MGVFGRVPWKEKTPSQKLRAVLALGILFFAFPFPMFAPLVLGMTADEFWAYYTPVFQGVLIVAALGAFVAFLMMLYEIVRRKFGRSPKKSTVYGEIETRGVIAFTQDILTKEEASNKDEIYEGKPVKSYLKATFGLAVLICVLVIVVALVIGNYTLEPQGNHSPAYQVGRAIPPFIGQYPYLLLIPLILSAVVHWKVTYKPTVSGIYKKLAVFGGNMHPEMLDIFTLERSGKRFRPPHGKPLRVLRDSTLEVMAGDQGHAEFYFNDEPAPQPRPEPPKAKPEPRQKPPPIRPKKLKPKDTDEPLFERQVFEEPEPEKEAAPEPPKPKVPKTRRDKLEALANDPNATLDERIAALNKLKGE